MSLMGALPAVAFNGGGGGGGGGEYCTNLELLVLQ